MTEESIFEGKDLEEALDAASTTLGVPEADLHYEILEQGRRGVLGFGAKSVRIRIKPPLEEPVEEQAEEPALQPARKPKREKPAHGKSRRGGRGNAKRGQGKRGRSRREQPLRGNPQRDEQPAVKASPEQTAEVEKTVRQMVELMGLEVTVDVGDGDAGVNLRLEGPDRKLLMEKNAELLWAIQFLLNRMSRRAWPGVGRIHLACNGQTRGRDDELVELVKEVARQVSKTGKTKKLQPMNAYERRLVHLTVREFAGLTSSSDGDGTMKRVRISKVQNQI